MKIIRTDIYKFSIPMHPFTIATGTMNSDAVATWARTSSTPCSTGY